MEIKVRSSKNNFLGLPEKYSNFNNSKIVILTIPFENSTSYGAGTRYAPRKIVEASPQLEFFDIEIGREICFEGIATIEEFISNTNDNKKAVNEISSYVQYFLKNKKIPVIIGGEHSISIGSVMALSQYFNEFTVLCMDAHCDLYDSYQNNPYGHASVLRRIYEIHKNVISMGIRTAAKEEVDFFKENGLKVFYATEIREKNLWDNIVEMISDNVFISFDFDFFDPSVIPAVGTPEPDGFLWNETLCFFKSLIQRKKVIGIDFVEFSPIEGQFYSDYIAAKFIYKIIGYMYLYFK